MRYILVALVALVIFPHYVFADDSNQLDVRSIPSQLMANTDGMIQVYPKTYGSVIDNLVATSSDSSIVQIVDVEKDTNYGSYDIKIKALNAGQTTIAMAASGFSSLELPVTVNPDSEGATNLLIKTTPNTFSTSGPNVGYVAVETTNPSGIPTPVSVDTPITLSVSDNNVVSTTDNQMVIKQGSYYATEKFITSKPGTVTISASSASLAPVSATITNNNVDTQYVIQSYAYPQVVNTQKGAVVYVIVQLHGSSGNPVLAPNDIPVSVSVINGSNSEPVNTSEQSPLVQINDVAMIKKGSYWGYTPVQFTAGVAGPFNVIISAKGYAVSNVAVAGSTTSTSTTSTSTTSTTSATTPPQCVQASISQTTTSFQTVDNNILLDNKLPCFDELPILTTGNNELIGVLYLVDAHSNPILANSDLQFRIDSSDPSTISVPGVEMSHGSQSALVFANVGKTVNPVFLNIVSDSPQTVSPTLTAPAAVTSGLVADSLIPTVLPHTIFPLAIYTTNNGALDSFKNDFDALISPQESISPIQLSVTKGDPIFLSDETLLKDGKQQISVTTPDYSSSLTITGSSSKPNGILLNHPDQILSNSTSLLSIELLDGNNLPMLADQDMDIQLVSSNPSVLTVPDHVQIQKGSYYTTFDANSKAAGTAEIAVLTDEIPLSKFDVGVTSFTPAVSINSVDHDDNNYPFTATVTATYNQLPLSGLTVNWKVTGATIKNMETLTGKDGNAIISLIANDPNTVNIDASVGGGAYQTVTVTKQVSINPPLQPNNSTSQSTQDNSQATGFTVMGVNPLLFIIPGAAAAAFIVLKKKDMLEGISEKINIAGKFSGIKERMSESRQK